MTGYEELCRRKVESDIVTRMLGRKIEEGFVQNLTFTLNCKKSLVSLSSIAYVVDKEKVTGSFKVFIELQDPFTERATGDSVEVNGISCSLSSEGGPVTIHYGKMKAVMGQEDVSLLINEAISDSANLLALSAP